MTRTRFIASRSWRTSPVPRTTHVSGSSATWTGIWVASATRLSRPGEERAAAGEDDALVHDVGDELGRRLLDRVADRVDDLLDGRLDRLADLVRSDLDAARQAGEQVAAAEVDPADVPLAGRRGADRDLDVLGRPLAEVQVVLAPGVVDDVDVHLVAADADRSG